METKTRNAFTTMTETRITFHGAANDVPYYVYLSAPAQRTPTLSTDQRGAEE